MTAPRGQLRGVQYRRASFTGRPRRPYAYENKTAVVEYLKSKGGTM